MYGMHVSSHSSGRKIRQNPSSVSYRQQQGQHVKALNQGAIDISDKTLQSFPKKLFAFLRQTWSGMTASESDVVEKGRSCSPARMQSVRCNVHSSSSASPDKKKLRRLISSAHSEFEDLDGHPVHFKPAALDTLCQLTKFSRRELKLMYRSFKQEAPSGVVKEETFKVIYAQFFPKGADTNQYAHFVFKTFDPDNTGCITFTDFIIGLSVLARGSIQDKLRWTFSLYDINGDGIITKDELARIVAAVYDLMGRAIEPAIDDDTAREHLDRVFKKLDLNNDGVVTVEEFLDSCLRDDTIRQSLNVFNTVL